MDVLMPQLGETVKEGTLAAWFKKPGDMVKAGEPLFEIETDKTAMEVQALSSGQLADVRVKVGETVPVGAVLATIAGADAANAPVAQAAPVQANGHAEPGRANGHAAPLDPFNEVRTPALVAIRAQTNGIRITPLARRMIAQNGLNVVELAQRKQAEGGTRIAARDVESALARGPAPTPHPEPAPAAEGRVAQPRGESFVLNRIRQQTGRRLAEAWRTAPHVFQAVEIDFSAVTRVRDVQKAEFRARHGSDLTFLPFIARATCLALAAFPQVNATFDGDRLVLSRDVNLGIAVDLSHDGLVVPVLQQAQELNVVGLACAIGRLVETARTGRLTPAEMQGGTYTISNNGAFGTLFTAPLINLPQVAILSTDAIRKRPVVVETDFGDAIVARPVGVVAQSFDHRAFDGAYSAAYLARLKNIIETRDWASEFA